MVAVSATDQDGEVPTPLAAFSPQTRRWFETVFAEPTPAQDAAWQAISAGQQHPRRGTHRLGQDTGCLPLGARPLREQPPKRTPVRPILYISPLKALAVDIERNLRAPLAGIGNAYELDGLTPPDISVAIRTGDTPASERQRQLRRPEHPSHHDP